MNEARGFPEAPRPSRPDVRAAAELLVDARRGRLGAARAAVTHDSARVRSAALRALERAGALDDATLVAAAGDRDPTVRRLVAELAAGHPDVALEDLLDDDDARVVEMACWAAGERADDALPDEALHTMCSIAADHPDALCREAAVAALGAAGRPETLAVVLAAMADRATVRRRAVLAMAAFDDPQVEEALERARTDRDWQVRQAAEDLLA